MDTEIKEKRKVGRPRKIKEEKIKRGKGKPKNTKNDYNKKYIWGVYEGNKDVVYYDNIKDISNHYGFTQSKISRVIYDNSKIKEIPNFTIKKVIKNLHHEESEQQDEQQIVS